MKRRQTLFLDAEQAYIAGLARGQFGPLAEVVVFDGKDGELYAEIQAPHAGHAIYRLDRETKDIVWVGDCHPGVANRIRTRDLAEVWEPE